MKKILVVLSVYRQGERIYPIIPKLSCDFELSLLCVHQMSERMSWNGDIDMRNVFHNKYDKYFSKTYHNWTDIDFKEYDTIILDDCRDKGDEIPYKLIFKNAKINNPTCTVIANQHGNRDFSKKQWEISHYKQVFDYCFVFGENVKELIKKYTEDSISDDVYVPSGIPANDELHKYTEYNGEYILIITNFLENERKVFPNTFGNGFVRDINLKRIQDKYQKPVLVKIKNRHRHWGQGNPYHQDINFVESVLKNNNISGTVIRDVEDDNLLIAKAHSVIGVSSTLCFKPIQLGIPTVILEGGNFAGALKRFPAYCHRKDTEYFLQKQITSPQDKLYVEKTIKGGVDYLSTDTYITELKRIINN